MITEIEEGMSVKHKDDDKVYVVTSIDMLNVATLQYGDETIMTHVSHLEIVNKIN